MKRLLTSLAIPALALASILPTQALTTQEITTTFKENDFKVEDLGDDGLIKIGPYVVAFFDESGQKQGASSDKQIRGVIVSTITNGDFAKKYNMGKLTSALESEMDIDLDKLSDEAYMWSTTINFKNKSDQDAFKELLGAMEKLVKVISEVTGD